MTIQDTTQPIADNPEVKPELNGVSMEDDFYIALKKFAFYSGANYYLDCRSMVFNLDYLAPIDEKLEGLRVEAVKRFPRLINKSTANFPELFGRTLVQVLKMDLNLYIDKVEIRADAEEHTISVEVLDNYLSEDCAYFVADWFEAILTEDEDFDFEVRFNQLKKDFNDGVYGGPTIYSIIEAAMKRNVPVNYLTIERQFQWGFGKNSVRGRSTIFDVDGVKDTEFTEFKDECKRFLSACGFPTPKGANFMKWENIVEEAKTLGFPVVLKPVTGHKGQGVTTNIESFEDLKEAYDRILEHHKESGTESDGIIIEQQVYGNDHRLLAIGGKFVAALEREPAFVIGNGEDTIETLIHHENNNNPNRSDNLRAPLAVIKIDDDMKSFLALQELELESVLEEGQKVFLRRVANISAGGLSKNVTERMHSDNVQLVENIASFFRITAMGIDVITDDISKSWQAGNFGIIEINAGPGIYMHLAPAIGNPIDVPSMIMQHFFPKIGASRIPIIVGNQLSRSFCNQLRELALKIDPNFGEFGSVTDEGAYLNGKFFTNNAEHDINVQLVLRHINLGLAVFQHTRDNIHDFGTYHQGADIAILEDPNYAEEILRKDLLPNGYVVKVSDVAIEVMKNKKSVHFYPVPEPSHKEGVLLEVMETLLLPELLKKYN